jgi:hypothetical protein
MDNRPSLDWEILEQTLNAPKVYKLADVEHRIEKVAFDIVRFRDNDDTQQLWRIEDRDDGPVIVALYDENGGLAEDKPLKSESEWDTIVDKKTASIHLYRNEEPVMTVTAAQLRVPVEELDSMARWLPEKLADKQFVNQFVRYAKRNQSSDEDEILSLTAMAGQIQKKAKEGLASVADRIKKAQQED